MELNSPARRCNFLTKNWTFSDRKLGISPSQVIFALQAGRSWLQPASQVVVNLPTGRCEFLPALISALQTVLKICPCQISFFRPEVGTWYLVYQGRQPWNHVWHGLVMGDHVRISKSSNPKVDKFSKADVILNSPAGSWSLFLSFIKRTTIKSHIAQSGYGRLRNTVSILRPVIWGFLIRRLNTIFRPEDCCSTE